MKILVIGDSHNNISNLRHVMGYGIKIKAQAVIHTGDWSNFDNIKTVTDFGIPLYSCLGNADIDPNFDLKDFLEFEIDGKKIYLVHRLLKKDTKYIVKDIVFTGHYHSQKIWEQDGVKIVRPGALEKEINFAVYDTKTNEVELFHE